MLPCVIEEIRRLSQKEGMTDSEIAEYLGCSRATVNRNRKKYGIPTANLENRQDKRFRCVRCGQEAFVRRGAPRRLYCDKCEKLSNDMKVYEMDYIRELSTKSDMRKAQSSSHLK